MQWRARTEIETPTKNIVKKKCMKKKKAEQDNAGKWREINESQIAPSIDF